jgi:hypothetical protein
MIVFIGMETSGALRRRFQLMGHETYSCDLLPSEDGGEEMAYDDEERPLGRHMVGDVFDTLANMRACDLWPQLAIFHPTCTYLTSSAEWAYGDGPYHQQVKPGTLVGVERRMARHEAIADFMRLANLDIDRIAIENPIGCMSRHYRQSDQIVHPHQFGDDASKATCLWLKNLPKLEPTHHVEPRMVGNRPRWANQTDSGQNRLSPAPDRWKNRSRTYDGIASAMALQWGNI